MRGLVRRAQRHPATNTAVFRYGLAPLIVLGLWWAWRAPAEALIAEATGAGTYGPVTPTQMTFDEIVRRAKELIEVAKQFGSLAALLGWTVLRAKG